MKPTKILIFVGYFVSKSSCLIFSDTIISWQGLMIDFIFKRLFDSSIYQFYNTQLNKRNNKEKKVNRVNIIESAIM